MRILFLAHPYFDLYKLILNEMQNQGHDVHVIIDKRLPFDFNQVKKGKIATYLFPVLRRLFAVEGNYWKGLIKDDQELNKPFDRFVCIQGVSFTPYLLKHLKQINPNIKSVLYAWDTARHYDFFRYRTCFDRCYTFDCEDANRIDGVELLPSYWVPSEKEEEDQYFISMVGSDHDDRLEILSKIVPQLEAHQKPYFFRVVLSKAMPNKYLRPLSYKKRKAHMEQYSQLSYTTFEKIPVPEVTRIINSSSCILDTDMPVQTGATERVIWSLARGKKVVSTNSYLKNMPFYDENQIQIIDRHNPVIDFSFFERKVDYNKSYFDQLRIDNWVKFLLK